MAERSRCSGDLSNNAGVGCNGVAGVTILLGYTGSDGEPGHLAVIAVAAKRQWVLTAAAIFRMRVELPAVDDSCPTGLKTRPDTQFGMLLRLVTGVAHQLMDARFDPIAGGGHRELGARARVGHVGARQLVDGVRAAHQRRGNGRGARQRY